MKRKQDRHRRRKKSRANKLNSSTEFRGEITKETTTELCCKIMNRIFSLSQKQKSFETRNEW